MTGGGGERLVLTVDLGTGGPKVGFVSLAGRIVWSEHTPVETRRLPGGGVVQDAGEWWDIVRASARRGRAAPEVSAAPVVAVSVTSQWSSIVPVDAEGEPVGDCVMWMDTRGARHSRALMGGPVMGYDPRKLATWVRRTAGAPSPAGGDTLSHILHLERDEPEIAAAARWFLEPADYLTMRFTGRAVATHASMLAAWLTDNRRLDRLAYDERLISLAGIDPGRLAPLAPTGSVVGTVRPDVAAELGLGADVPVAAGTPDLHSAAAGAGAVEDFAGHFSISTTSWISCPVPFKKTDALHSIASVPGLRPDRYLVADNHESAGACLQWLRDRVLDGDFDDFTALAETAPRGSGGVIFTPWLAGERSPVDDRRARGGWHNLSLETTRADLVRALLEGVAYNSRWLLDAVEKFVGRPLDPLRVVGGGARSDLWCQIHADVLGRRVERVADPAMAHLRGAAVIAGLAIGAVRPAEVRGLVPVDRVFSPDAEARADYAPLYAEFPRLYRAQKGMFARLNARA